MAKIERETWLRGERGDRDSLIGWFIICCISAQEQAGNGKVTDIGRPKEIVDGKEQTVDEIILTVNGIDIDVMPAFKRLEEHLDRTSKELAGELLKEHCSVEIEKITEVLKSAKDEIRKKLEESLGIKLPDEDNY